MTDDATLGQFIAHARSKGMDFATIRALLLSAGWKEKDVVRAMSDESLDLAVPVPPDVGGARDAFMHLFAFVAFYTAVISLVLLFFLLIERALPDPTRQGNFIDYFRESSMRWLIAQVLIGFPVFMLLWRKLLGEVRQRPEKGASPIRRWLSYLTLLFAASTLMCTGMTLLYYFLDGELTLRFVLKVIVLALVATLSLVYFQRLLRGAGEVDPIDGGVSWHRRFGFAAMAIVAAGLIWGMSAVGSPFEQRARKMDDRRVGDLRDIVGELRRIAVKDRSESGPTLIRPLPKTLAELVEAAEYTRPSIVDPETGGPYEYEVLAEGKIRLCATFSRVRDERTEVTWNHPAGRACFVIDLLKGKP
jgi:hypothetical protein